MRFFFAAGIFLCVALTGAQLYAKCPEVIDETMFMDLQGRPVKFSCSDHKVLVVNFWATWCSPCKAEIRGLIDLNHEFKANGVHIIGVSLDSMNLRGVRLFIKAQKIDYTVYVSRAEDVFSKWNIRGIPTTFIFDRKGNIYKKLVGLRSKSELRNAIRELIGNNN